MMEWFGLEGTFGIAWFRPPAVGGGASLQPRLLNGNIMRGEGAVLQIKLCS